MTDLEAFLRWLFENNKKDVDIPPMTPRGKQGDYLSEGSGKGATDLALLAEAAATQANMDAAEPNRDIGDPMSESQKALAEIRDSVLRGQVALAQARTWSHGLRESVCECIILRLYVFLEFSLTHRFSPVTSDGVLCSAVPQGKTPDLVHPTPTMKSPPRQPTSIKASLRRCPTDSSPRAPAAPFSQEYLNVNAAQSEAARYGYVCL